MIPYEIDPSLYTAEPEQPMLDDGFSPPHSHERATNPAEPAGDAPGEAAPAANSPA